jgi:hypothetical protein
MRTPNINSAFYSPQPAPSNPADLASYIQRELAAIQNVIEILASGHIDMTYAAPDKPRDGDIRLADGTSFNPGGGGKGFYGYYNNTWNRLG